MACICQDSHGMGTTGNIFPAEQCEGQGEWVFL